MSTETLNPITIRKRGLQALAKALGPVGMVRFLQQFEGGTGDYTRERSAWLEDRDIKAVIKEIKIQRRKK